VAFAGTGKTTCLRAYALARPHLKVLYLTYNVSVRDEALSTFPPNVSCKGIHQLAYARVGYRYADKLAEDLRPGAVADFLKVSLSSAQLVIETLSSFLSSSAPTIAMEHVVRAPESMSSANCGSGNGDDSTGGDDDGGDDGGEEKEEEKEVEGRHDGGRSNVLDREVERGNSGSHGSQQRRRMGGDQGTCVLRGDGGGVRNPTSERKPSSRRPCISAKDVHGWACMCWEAMRAAPSRRRKRGGRGGANRAGDV
ncbi:unnamed protein product, partial [Discosporangium mesarthrocarpum]